MHMRKRPGITARARAAKRRKEGPVATLVRDACVDRDGYCRVMGIGFCAGPSQWAHLGQMRRCHTRGLAPERRHTEAGSLMLCEYHHGQYDAHRLAIDPVDPDKGAIGYLAVTVDGVITHV